MPSNLSDSETEQRPAVPATSAPPAPAGKADLLPGLALCVVGALLAMGIGRLLPTVSPLLIAIVGGAVMANLVKLPARLRPGLTFSSKRLLRVGIALLGLQLMFSDILGLGWGVIAVVVAPVGSRSAVRPPSPPPTAW